MMKYRLTFKKLETKQTVSWDIDKVQDIEIDSANIRDQNVEERWKQLKRRIMNGAKEVIGKRKKEKQKAMDNNRYNRTYTRT